MYEIQVTGFKNAPDIHVGADTVFIDQIDGELALFTDQVDAARFRASPELLEACIAVAKYLKAIAARWEKGEGRITEERGAIAVGEELDRLATDAALKAMTAISKATARVCACGAPFVRHGEETETCVGAISLPDPNHNHNDNCLRRDYFCANGHRTTLSLRRRCPTCDWAGIRECACHHGLKVEQWPEVA